MYQNIKEIIKPELQIDMDDIAEVVCEYFGVSKNTLLKGGRKHRPANHRHIMFYICVLAGYTPPEIYRKYGFHRGTVRTAVKKIDGYCDIYKEIKKDVDAIKKEVIKKFIKKLESYALPEM